MSREKHYEMVQRLWIILFIHNSVVAFFILSTLVLYGVVFYLIYWMVLWLIEIPLHIWGGILLALVLGEVALLISRQGKSGEKDQSGIFASIFNWTIGFFLFLLGNFWIVTSKLVLLGREKRYLSAEVLDYLYRQKQAVPIADLARVILEKKLREKAEESSRTSQVKGEVEEGGEDKEGGEEVVAREEEDREEGDKEMSSTEGAESDRENSGEEKRERPSPGEVLSSEFEEEKEMKKLLKTLRSLYKLRFVKYNYLKEERTFSVEITEKAEDMMMKI